ncbi:MAG: type II toxin-antitoxin system VapC family toxin [Betaproteobacteria bacterium]|nr:type II toxin-antitoxin system VapC family toxin [Betaproteobacteria bacterium]
MNVLDSSAWLEYLNGGSNAPRFQPVAADTATLIIPTIVLYEVFKLILRVRGEVDAQRVAAAMRQARVVAVDEIIALSAAKLSLQHRLAMADSLILASSRTHGAILWTQDEDFRDIADVRYFTKG